MPRRITDRPIRGLLALLLLLLAALPVGAQEPQPRRVRVFLDCQTHNCNSSEFRTEISWVDWVVERTASDVHVIMTSNSSGAGTRYTFDFVGRNELSGKDERLTVDGLGTDSYDEIMRLLTRVLRAGLVRYAALRGAADVLEVREVPPPRGASARAAARDPWRSWIFRVRADADMDGEEQRWSREFEAAVSANRTTADWKIAISLDGSSFRSEVELNEGERFDDRRDSWEADGLIVRTVAPHWSTGMQLDASTSTAYNLDLGTRAAAALEWSLFPYEEANRRQLVVHYQLGVWRVRYQEPTIFGLTRQTVGDQRLGVSYGLRQPWGSAYAGLEYANYLDDFRKYHVGVGGDLSVRIYRGLDVYIEAEWQRVKDQIYLPAGGLTDEEILVQRRQLGTAFEYDTRIGLSYRFGSIFNSVVNNRFPGSVRW